MLEHRGDQPRELLGRGRDRFRGPQSGLHPAEKRPSGTLAVVQGRGCQAPRGGRPVGTGLGAPAEDLAAGDALVRTAAQPRREVLHGWPATPIPAHRAEDAQGRRRVKALDLAQGHPGEPMQGVSDGAGWLVAARLPGARCRGQRVALRPVCTGLESGCDLAVALRALLMIHLREGHGLGQRAQMLLAPMALSSPGHGGLVVLTPGVTAWGERPRIALPCEDRTEDRPARHPGDVPADVRQLAVHLRERLWPLRTGLARLGQEHGALAEVAAEHADRVRGPERPRQEAKGREALDPLAVMPVTCGPALAVLAVLRVAQAHLAATCLKQLTEGDPRDPSGFHGDRGARPRDQPSRQGFAVGRGGGTAAHRLGSITGGDRHIMGFGPDIDAGGMAVGGRPWRRPCGLGTGLFLLAWGHGPLHKRRGRRSAAGAGAAGVQHSSTRDQGIACHP